MKLKRAVFFLSLMIIGFSLFIESCDYFGLSNTSPNATFIVTPEFGDTHTVFRFDASGCNDRDIISNILLVSWDWENDGFWDIVNTKTKGASHKFANYGTYTVKLEVRDHGGLTDVITKTIVVTNNPPTAYFTVSPSTGTNSTVFNFDASECNDLEDPTSDLQVRWDWENDGIWDINYTTTKTVTHQYNSFGIKVVNMEVKDISGMTNSTTKSIIVYAQGTFTDSRDGISYKWRTIGNQIWMAENLNFETDTGSWAYNNKAANADKYGRLYLWESAMNSCPDGWHLPSDNEWQKLELFLGIDISEVHLFGPRSSGIVGPKLKEGGTSGFNALYAGKRNVDSIFSSIESSAYFWTATFHSGVHGYHSRHLRVLDSYIRRDPENLKMGLSVRCLKD